MLLKNKTILITGGSAGIGLEAAKQFLAEGANVIITGRNQVRLDAAQKQYPDLIAIQSDASKEEDMLALYEQVKTLGGIDILYNNAGVDGKPANLGIADEQHVKGAIYEMEVNYLGVIRLNNLFLDMLKARPEAAIINTTSILSIVPFMLEATYSASKTALSFYTKMLREHLSIVNNTVKVFELLPPLVETDMTTHLQGKKISPKQLVEGLIKGLKSDEYTIRVGDSKAMYYLNRFFPKKAFGMINSKKVYEFLKK